MDQTVNLLSSTSEVRILLSPLERLKIIMMDSNVFKNVIFNLIKIAEVAQLVER